MAEAVAARPHVVVSCAVSLDGYLDDASPERLVLSGPEDLDAVDALRASVDAILVGAGTLRADDPRLLVRSQARRAERVARGRPPSPLRVTLTASGELDPGAAWLAVGEGRLVYAATPALGRVRAALGAAAEVADAGGDADLQAVLADLSARGVGRLLVEGGSRVLAQVLGGGLADELRLAVAPVLVADPRAPRLVAADGRAHAWPGARLRTAEALGGTAVLTYDLR